ncbi:MAG: GAF domain-containing protein [Akkermansiaceae bacterium]
MIELDEVAQLLAEQRRLLEMIAVGEPTTESLTALCLAVPRLSPRARACILLADKSCLSFPRSITPGFPASFGEALAGAPIAEDAIGTCAAAVFRGEQVACGDIAFDGPWSEVWRDVCLAHGVMACVSEPIHGPEGIPLGSFVLCFDEPRERTEWEQRLIKVSSFIASIALTRDQTAAALRQSEERYRTLFRAIHAGFCVVELLDGPALDFRLIECNPMFQRMTGFNRPIGQTARALAYGLDESWFELLAGVAVSGQSVGLEKRAWDRWYEVYSYRIDQAGDRRIAVLFDDITHRKRNEMNLEFLASVSQDLNRESSPEVIMNAMAESIGHFLNISLCTVKEMPESDEQMPVVCAWQRDDLPDGVGFSALAEYPTEEFHESAREGETFVVRDTASDRRVRGVKSSALPIRSLICAPVLRDGHLRFALGVYDERPRVWRADEIELLERLAGRIWTRVERARTEQALFESERQLRQIFEAAKDYAIFAQDLHGSITSWSPGAERLFSYQAEEVMGQHVEMIFTPLDRAKQVPLREMEQALKSGVAEDERWHLRKDGSRFFASGLLQPIHDRCGKPLGFTKICRDRTAREQSREWLERELVDSQRLQKISARLVAEGDFASLLRDILQAAIAIARADMGAVRLAEDEDGMNLRLLVSEGFGAVPDALEQRCSRRKTGGFAERIWAGERVVISDLAEFSSLAESPVLVALTKAGVCAVQWTPLISRSGKLLGSIATHWKKPHGPGQRELRLLDLLARQAADLIERHQSQLALYEREQQLLELSQSLEKRVGQRTAELQEQTARLQRLAAELASAEQRERKRLAALLHDDLQQLLVAASMQLGLAETSRSETAAARAISQAAKWIEEARNAARDLTRQLRPPALYEDGLIAALHWLASEMQTRHHLEVEIDGKEPALSLSDDTKALLFECVRELLFNVAKYAGVSRTKVTLREANGRLELVVADSGLGFDVETIGTWRKSGGFGLFSIRERLIALGGEMIMISAPGQGTRVELHAPVDQRSRRMATRQIELLTSPLVTPVTESGSGSGCDPRIHVLVVDDHPMVREGIANLLDGDSRLSVCGQAADGIEAISAVECHLPDVVLMDVNMPRMNGIEATREIHRRWPQTRIIGLSVQDDATTAKSMCDAGAAAFISKSGASEAMIAAILAQAPNKFRLLDIAVNAACSVAS